MSGPTLRDEAAWLHMIDAAIAVRRPVLCNLRVTLAHDALSRALHEVTGAESGANFHTWAVWGSVKAGETIRRGDLPALPLLVAAAGAALGGVALGVTGPGSGRRRRGLLGGVAGAAAGLTLVRRGQAEAAAAILAGNITVLDDIGRPTVRFVAAFHDRRTPDPERLRRFLASLRPGAAEAGGQDLLRRAFTHYYLARFAPDANARHEHMLLANCTAILHEHHRLQPYISRAMPGPLRRQVTACLLDYRCGEEQFDVSDDLTPHAGEPFPETLARLENEELRAFLTGADGWDRTPDSLAGSRAADWSCLGDRMNYIVDLFRSRHLHPGLFVAPYTEAQRRQIMAGRVPAGPL